MNKQATRSWIMYDWANSAYAATIMAAVFPIFFYDVAAKGLSSANATAFYGYGQSFAMLIIAILSPVLGAMADIAQTKKKLLLSFTFLGIVTTMLMAFINEGDYIFALCLAVLSAIGFAGATTFYDALLPDVSTAATSDRVSSLGFAAGYLGGGLLLALNLAMILKADFFGFANGKVASQVAFVTVGIWWFVFSIPLMRHVHERPRAVAPLTAPLLTTSFNRLRQTFRDIRHYRVLFTFLVAYWLYNDGISTIIHMATIYGRAIGIGSSDLITALLITQFIGIPFSFLFGMLAEKFSAKRALIGALVGYVLIVIGGYFMATPLHFYLLAGAIGIVQGGAQALSRSVFMRLVPPEKETEFFGFFGVPSKFSAIIGPFLFALVGQLTGSPRFGIVTLLVFFIVGIVILVRLPLEEGRAVKAESNIA